MRIFGDVQHSLNMEISLVRDSRHSRPNIACLGRQSLTENEMEVWDVVSVALSIASSRPGIARLLIEFVALEVNRFPSLDAVVSTLSVWDGLHKERAAPESSWEKLIAEAAAADDVSAIGRMLLGRNANVDITERDFPDALARQPEHCLLLDIAVGCGSVSVTKCLLEFHRASHPRYVQDSASEW
jgi:hypothetical protein